MVNVVSPYHVGADQRGFPKASGGRDEGQLAVQPYVEPRDQAGAGDPVRPQGRLIQFRS